MFFQFLDQMYSMEWYLFLNQTVVQIQTLLFNQSYVFKDIQQHYFDHPGIFRYSDRTFLTMKQVSSYHAEEHVIPILRPPYSLNIS